MQFGDYRIEIIPDSEFRLDGGTMFGVVPRVLWERKCPADHLNRIQMNMNCLFVETPDDRILVETGIGEKWSETETKINGIFRKKPFAQSLFEKTGFRPKDISIVVNTHLHFDHAGGNTILSEPSAAADGLTRGGKFSANNAERPEIRKPTPQFENARYFVSRSELEQAENPHERNRASYIAENWKPVEQSGQLELKLDDYEVVEGLSMQTIRGHSETMQTVKLKRGGKTLYGFADLIPMTAHLPLPWIAGFDLFPMETLEAKRDLLQHAVKEDWICLMYHDPDTPLCRLEKVDGRLNAVKI